MRSQSTMHSSDGIIFSHICKTFGKEAVFSDFSMKIAPRGVTAIMGPSGSGKTTLTRMLLGLCKPDSGEIQNPYTAISSVFQDPRLIPWMTAIENVAFALSAVSHPEKLRIAKEKLTALGLSEALNKFPAELSGGMQQRVSLARAFAAPHDLLILDEPFRGLDEENKHTVLSLIRAEAETVPVILITHDPDDIDALNAAKVLIP